MEQVTVLGADWGVADGIAEGIEGEEAKPLRMAIFTDKHSGRIYQFPLLLEEAKRMGAQLVTDDLDKLREEEKASVDLLVPDREPTEDELRRMEAQAQGKDPGTVAIRPRDGRVIGR